MTENKISIKNYGIANVCKSSKYFVCDIDSLKKAVEYSLDIATLLLEIKFFNKQMVFLWDQTQHHFSLIVFSIMNGNI